MKEFIEKLIGRLEEEISWYETHGCNEDLKRGIIGANRHAIDLVNQLAEEYKDKEYCWQECASTEHCKECSRLGNGDIDYFESIDDWAESLSTIDAGELFGNGWIPCGERLPDDFMSMEYLATTKACFYPKISYYCVANHKWYSNRNSTKEIEVIAWQPLPAPYQPKEK